VDGKANRDNAATFSIAYRIIVKSSNAINLFFILLLPAVFLSAGCGNQPADSADMPSADTVRSDEVEIDWGREVSLDEMIAMAQGGRIQEIQWHVMPNILRASASDGSVFHLRNENKGVDLRKTLIEAGVKIGKGGIPFRHHF
ncbi:MAG: hypothetical protein JXR49_13330, partial [Acidobacteria bacterium]|nr:hypothetical protein [Acidobacteriota bacterium]